MYLNLIKIHYGGLFLILVVLMAQKSKCIFMVHCFPVPIII